VLLGLQFILALANGWVLLGCLSVIYLAALLLAIRTRQREGFYEWFVEGILFLPAVTEAWKHFAG
jgi:hypothetical protein